MTDVPLRPPVQMDDDDDGWGDVQHEYDRLDVVGLQRNLNTAERAFIEGARCAFGYLLGEEDHAPATVALLGLHSADICPMDCRACGEHAVGGVPS